MFSGQNGRSLTATALRRSAMVSVTGTGTPSRVVGSPGITNKEKENNVEIKILAYLCNPVQKTGRQVHLLQGFQQTSKVQTKSLNFKLDYKVKKNHI